MEDIRESIDSIDQQIVELIGKRARYVKNAAQFKKDITAVKDKERFKRILKSKRELAEKNNLSPNMIEELFTNMITFFINEEIDEWKKHK